MINSKVLSVDKESLYEGKGYKILKKKENYLIADRKYALLSCFALTRRFFRAEITGLYVLKNGDRLAIAKKGLFLQKQGGKRFEKSFAIPRGSKPLNLCITPSGKIFFGEYFQNMEKQAVNIYCSKDNAQTWNIAYTFAEGEINHIHGLFFDPFTNRIWVATGDRENECIIGYTDDEFLSFNEVFRGGQEYRTCQLFFYKDYVVFATDSQYISNKIKSFDRESFEIKTLANIQGSAIKGGQSGNVSFLSTSIEPSEVNTDPYAHVWLTKDGILWHEVYSAKKDMLPSIFQFGTFEFPNYQSEIKDKFYFSGRALKGCGGKTICIDISNL